MLIIFGIIIFGILLSGVMFLVGTVCYTQKYNRTILVEPAYKPEDWFVPVGFTYVVAVIIIFIEALLNVYLLEGKIDHGNNMLCNALIEVINGGILIPFFTMALSFAFGELVRWLDLDLNINYSETTAKIYFSLMILSIGCIYIIIVYCEELSPVSEQLVERMVVWMISIIGIWIPSIQGCKGRLNTAEEIRSLKKRTDYKEEKKYHIEMLIVLFLFVLNILFFFMFKFGNIIAKITDDKFCFVIWWLVVGLLLGIPGPIIGINLHQKRELSKKIKQVCNCKNGLMMQIYSIPEMRVTITKENNQNNVIVKIAEKKLIFESIGNGFNVSDEQTQIFNSQTKSFQLQNADKDIKDYINNVRTQRRNNIKKIYSKYEAFITGGKSKEYAADLHIDFIGNLIFSKYDVNLVIDGENVETIPHGEDRNIQKDFTVGEHKISFEKVDDASVRGELVLNVTSDLEAEYSISCENDKIIVTENYIDYKAKLAEGQTKATKSWEDFISVNYSEAVTDLEGMGFTNVSAEPIYDIPLGITDEGKMAFITIDGHEDFRRGEVYNSDAEVIVKYHALKDNDPKVIAEKEKQQAEEEEKAKAREEATKKEAEEAAKKAEEEAARKEEEAAKKAEEEAVRKAEEEAKKAEEAAKKAEAEAAEKKAKENLTVDNCEALREILSMHASSDPAYVEFAEKYEGRNIEFDGSVDYCSPHGSFDTRFDFLLSAGDYNTDSQIGPTFKFEDKSKADLHSDLSAVGTGMNVHIIAKVEYFDSEHEIFYLNPVEVTGR